MKNLTLITGLLLLVCSNLSAQIPEDFNFLNHQKIDLEIIDIIEVDGSILAAHHLGVDVVEYDYTYQLLSQGCAEHQKLIFESNSSYHFGNWLFNCSDGVEDVLRTFAKRNNDLSCNEYRNVRNTHDITYDSTGGWWCFTNRAIDLLRLENGEIKDSFQLNNRINSRLFTSSCGRIYVSNGSELLHFSGDTLEYFNDLPITREVYHDGVFNYLLDKNKLYKYDCELHTQLRQWDLPIEVSSFKQLNITTDDKVYINEIHSSSYDIYGIDSLSNLELEYSSQIEPNEILSGIEVHTDTTHLIYGQHAFETISHNFYRNINTIKEIEYPTSDAEISQFQIQTTALDTVFDVFLDSFLLQYLVEPSFQVSNLSDEEVYAVSVRSNITRKPLSSFVPFQRMNYTPDSILSPQELIEVNSNTGLRSFQTYLDDIDNLKIELTGANYKFLVNGSIVLSPDITSSIFETITTENIEIFPNPASDRINISLDQGGHFSLVNNQGEILIKQNFGKGHTTFDISSLPNGVYFLINQYDKRKVRIGRFIKI